MLQYITYFVFYYSTLTYSVRRCRSSKDELFKHCTKARTTDIVWALWVVMANGVEIGVNVLNRCFAIKYESSLPSNDLGDLGHVRATDFGMRCRFPFRRCRNRAY